MTDLAGSYLALELTDASAARLLATFPPAHPKVYAHHITLEFNPAPIDLMFWPLEQAIPFDVVSYGLDEHAQAVRVELVGKTTRRDGKAFHVTVSVAQGSKPVDSNKIEAFVPVHVATSFIGSVKLLKK